MRLIVGFLESACLAVVMAVPSNAALGAANDPINAAAQYHCAGSAALAADTNLNGVFALPSTLALRQMMTEKFSGLAADGLNLSSNASVLIEPLLADFLGQESLGSFDGAGGGSLNFVLAIHLEAKRAQLWQNNLAQAFGHAGDKFSAEGFDGWRWNKGGSNLLWIVPAGDWMLVGCGDEFLPLQIQYLQEVQRQGRPVPLLKEDWLETDIDYARTASWWPDCSRLLKQARVKINVSAGQEKLRIDARVVYPEAIAWKSAAWQLPSELVRSPLISFTGGQNVAAFLNLDPDLVRLDGGPLTNQFFAWAMNQMPFQTYIAWPVTGASNTLAKLANEAVAAFNPDLKKFNRSELQWHSDTKTLVLANLRVVMPSLEAIKNKDGQYLLLSLFPLRHTGNSAPDKLWQEFSERTNLVYYDWESTGLRLQQWRLLGGILLRRFGLTTDDVGEARAVEDKWMSQLMRLPGDTVTEATYQTPQELTMVRDGPMGFTGVEIFLLLNWLNALRSS